MFCAARPFTRRQNPMLYNAFQSVRQTPHVHLHPRVIHVPCRTHLTIPNCLSIGSAVFAQQTDTLQYALKPASICSCYFNCHTSEYCVLHSNTDGVSRLESCLETVSKSHVFHDSVLVQFRHLHVLSWLCLEIPCLITSYVSYLDHVFAMHN